MADIRIADLTELTVPANADQLGIVDTSEDSTKRILVSNLVRPIELGVAEQTSLQTTTITTSTLTVTNGDITGLSLTVQVGDRPLRIVFWAPIVSNATGSQGVGVRILDVTGGNVVVGGGLHYSSAASEYDPLTAEARVNPAAGSRTYKAQFWCHTSGTASLAVNMGAAGTLPVAARLSVYEI